MTQEHTRVQPRLPRLSRRWMVGLAAITVTVCAWAGFALSARAITHSALTPLEVNAIRYLTPTLLLLPWWRQAWREARAAGARNCALVAIGGGLPFFLLTALGAQLSSAAHVTIINAGATPVLLALISAALGRGWPRPHATLGLGVITTGILVLALGTPGGGPGILALLGSAILWALCAMGQENAQLSPTTVALVISAPSALPALILAAPGALHLTSVPMEQIGFFLLTQGIGSGIISAISFAIAIRALGAPLAALIAALTPSLVAALSALLLGESLTTVAYAGLGLVLTGVLLRRPC